jgi:hypothetical protein
MSHIFFDVITPPPEWNSFEEADQPPVTWPSNLTEEEERNPSDVVRYELGWSPSWTNDLFITEGGLGEMKATAKQESCGIWAKDHFSSGGWKEPFGLNEDYDYNTPQHPRVREGILKPRKVKTKTFFLIKYIIITRF